MKKTMLFLGCSAVVLGLSACQPDATPNRDAPNPQASSAQMKEDWKRTGDALEDATKSTAATVGEKTDQLAQESAEAAGRASVHLDNATERAREKAAELGERVDQNTEQLQQSYREGQRQEQQENPTPPVNR